VPDWRWVTQTSSPNTLAHNTLPPAENGMWIDFDGLDSIMPMPKSSWHGANTRLGWLTAHGWHYLFIIEKVAPSTEGEEPTTHNQKEE